MKRNFLFFAALLLSGVALPLFAQETAAPSSGSPSSAMTIVTVEPKGSAELAAPVAQTEVQAKLAGKKSEITGWRSFTGRGTRPDLQLVLMIDDGARSSLGLHLKEMETFINSQAPTTEVALVYMRNGAAAFTAPFTTNHEQVSQTLRLPLSSGAVGSSPYFALSDLIKRWPEHDPAERREVVMITDGIDRYNGLRYDPSNPYINQTIRDCLRNQVVLYSIYFHNAGFADRTAAGIDSGQNYLTQLSQAVGGEFYYQGFGNPVDFTPYFKQINRKLGNQYELTVTPPPGAKNIVNLKVQVSAPNTKTYSAQQIYVGDGR